MTRPLYSTLITLLISCTTAHAFAESVKRPSPAPVFAFTAYQNVLSADPLEDILLGNADYEHRYQLTALALSRGFKADDPRYDYEWEVQIAKHTAGQDHEELNILIGARWYPFPWDRYIDTDFALGVGLSYATERPPFEARNHPDAAALLAYILLELEFRPKRTVPWSFVLRSHHRSGAFGMFSGVHGASNSLGLGVKYRF